MGKISGKAKNWSRCWHFPKQQQKECPAAFHNYILEIISRTCEQTFIHKQKTSQSPQKEWGNFFPRALSHSKPQAQTAFMQDSWSHKWTCPIADHTVPSFSGSKQCSNRLEKGQYYLIFWKGNWYATENYMPVSLTCICSKLLKHIVHSSVKKHLDW